VVLEISNEETNEVAGTMIVKMDVNKVKRALMSNYVHPPHKHGILMRGDAFWWVPHYLYEPTKRFEFVYWWAGNYKMDIRNFGISSWTAPWGGITAFARWKDNNRLYFGGLAPYNGRYETTIAMMNSIHGAAVYHLIAGSNGAYPYYYAPEYLEEI